MTSATAQTGSVGDGQLGAPRAARAARLRQRRRQARRRRSQRPPAVHQHRRHLATGPWTWTPDQLFGFNYPANNAGDDDLPGTAFQRSRGTSNDTWQNYLGVLGRQSGIGVVEHVDGDPAGEQQPGDRRLPGGAQGRWPVRGHAADRDRRELANDPNQNADGSPAPQPRLALRLRDWAARNEPLRAERIEADYATPVTYPTTGGAIISTRDSMTFGFGLEQVNAATRTELLKRSFDYLLPTAADTTPPTIDGFKWPPANFTATPPDPIEADVTAYDDRGDLKSVTLSADGAPVGTVTVFPFQFRYTPPASAVGRTVTLTAVATDKAGNTSTRTSRSTWRSGRDVESPLPVGPPTLTGSPTVGSAAGLHHRWVLQRARHDDVRVVARWRRHRGATGDQLHAHERRPRPEDRLPRVGHQRGRHG